VSRVNPVAIRRDRASELDLLARSLNQLGICDPYPLFEAATECRDGAASADCWGYTVANLVLRGTHKMRGFRPKEATDIHHLLDVELVGVCQEQAYVGDPFERLSVSILARAKVDQRNLLCAWHLDRHLTNVASEATCDPDLDATDDPLDACEIHPLYHFHFGGHRLTGPIDAQSADPGDVLLLEPPRLAHPPMDAVLAVDFVLSNFYPVNRRELLADNTYVNLVRNAQERYWKPYAQICAAGWAPGEFASWTPTTVWPNLHDDGA